MIQIDNALLSAEVFDEHFMCDLAACKGACCVQGDAGAPLEESELDVLDRIYSEVKPYLRPEGTAAIEAQGKYVKDDYDQEWVTPLVNDEECAYAIFTDDGTALCGIEKAYRDGKVDWPKPVSCHLYPIRIKQYRTFDAVNYDRWHICSPACDCGLNEKIKVYQFAKPALVRKYGASWYEELEQAAKLLEDSKRTRDSKPNSTS